MLHLFFNNPNRSFYVREITRKIEEQINSVRRELANMLSIGIIKSDSSNNRLYYEVNQAYTYYDPLRAIFSGIQKSKTVQQKAEADNNDWANRLKPLGDVRIAILSGQLVRGSSSELDVLIAGNVNKNQAKRLIAEIEEEEGKSLNFTVLSYEDFYYRLSVKDRFIMGVINDKFTLLQDQEGILSN